MYHEIISVAFHHSGVEAFRFSIADNRADDTYFVSGKSFINNDRMFFIAYEAVYPVESNTEQCSL